MEIQLNLNKICRLCLEEKYEQLEDVFGNESNLCENILRATTVKIQPGDGLPAHVCQQCVSLVNVVVNFQRKCVVADLALHHYVRKCICHKEHKECEAVKLYPRDPLQLTQVIKTEGGPCQIKSETRVFHLQESREEVITGIIEDGSSNPRVNVKPEMSESSIRTTKSVKGKEINSRFISVNVNPKQNDVAKIHKRRRRKGHRWKVKKQSSVTRKRDLGVHLPLQSTETLTAEASIQNQKAPANKNLIREESGQNRIISPASSSFTCAEEALPNTIGINTNKKTAKRGFVVKRSNSVIVSKKLLLKEQKRTSSDTVKMNKNSIKQNLQNKRVAQNSNAITVKKKTAPQNSKTNTVNKKTVGENLQIKISSQNIKINTVKNKAAEKNLLNRRASQKNNVVTVNKKMASKGSQQNTRASETSKAFLANQKLLKRNSFSRRAVTEDSTEDSSSTPNQKPAQIQRVLSPSRNLLREKLASERVTPNQMVQQSCNQKLQTDEQFQTGNSSNKKPATTEESTSTQMLPQNSKSVLANQRLVAENQIQRVSPMRKSLLEKQITLKIANSPGIISLVNQKLITKAHVQIQKDSSSTNCSINKAIREKSTLRQNAPPSSNSMSQTQRMSLKRSVLRRTSVTGECPQKGTSPTSKTPETIQNGALLPSTETFQVDKLATEEDYSDTLPANENHLQNTPVTKRKTPETESSVPEPSSTKKQKTQENDRLTRLVIQVEGNKLCCSQCDSWFEDVEELKCHLEEQHKKRVVRWHTVMGPGPEKDAPSSLLCVSCGKQFTSQRLFTVHHNQKLCS